MEKVIVVIGGVVLFVAIVLGLDWLLWKLWCWVLPQLWESGPENIVRPGFWLFVAATFLFSWLATPFRARGRK